MATTTFKGPVTSLNGFIGGANPNAGTSPNDTQQGGNTPFTRTSNTVITAGSTSLVADVNEGVMIYVQDGANGAATYAFSDGTSWLRCDTLANISSI